MSVLNITDNIHFDDRITKEQYHTYQPRSSNYSNSDEIRILIQQQDICILPSKSYLLIEGDVEVPATGNVSLTRNAYNFLFEEIRLEINGIEVDKVRDVGLTTTIKNYVSNKASNQNQYILHGWEASGGLSSYNKTLNKFNAIIPLNKLLGFAEDYKKIIVNARLELVILRSGTDKNCYTGTDGCKFHLKKIEWHIPHIEINDEIKLQMLSIFNTDKPIQIPFRKWELHELPALKKTDRDYWSVKTSTSLERPRYIIVCFQEDLKNHHEKDVTKFNHCNIQNIKIHLNSESYPYDNMNLDFDKKNYMIAYDMYCQFQNNYYNSEPSPYLDYNSFLQHPLFVFDVSKQNENIKSATIDLKIEMNSTKTFNEKTRAYCLILYDSVVEYTPLTGIVRKLL